jgi:urocanate hydratase
VTQTDDSTIYTSLEPKSPVATTALEVARVYDVFSVLVELAKARFSGELGGKLLLYGALDAAGATVALAGNIAGAATLGVDCDGERLKQGIRQAYCDFLVNNLDEALRILKNEIRKKQPVSVCLEADFAVILGEMVERGVQPDLLAFALPSSETNVLVERGAVRLGAFDLRGPVGEFGQEVTWSAASSPALWLAKADALAADVLPPDDPRRRWLRLAPRYLARSMTARRYLRMTSEEAERFSLLVAAAVASEAFGTEITVTR